MERKFRSQAILVVLMFASITGVIQLWLGVHHLVRGAGERLRSIVVTAASGLNGDVHERIAASGVPGGPDFVAQVSYLRRVQASNGLETEVYTLIPGPGGTRFILRTDSRHPFGEAYEMRSEMKPVFERGEPVVTGFYGDRHGSWISAYAPVFNSKGHVVALLEADYRMGPVLVTIAKEVLLFAGIALLGLAATIRMVRRVARDLARPLVGLTTAVDAMGRGDSDKPLPESAVGEIGALARRFGEMRQSVTKAHSEQRLALVGQMAATIVHDLRNPLYVITGYLQLAATEMDQAKLRRMFHTMATSAGTIEAMCRDLMDFVRGRSTFQPTVLPLNVILSDSCGQLEGLARSSHVALRHEATADLSVWGDGPKLVRAIVNLVRNSIEAMQNGGNVTLVGRSSGRTVQLDVIDDGPGLPAEVQANLFESLVSVGKVGGTGLGLAMVRRTVEDHGGTIQASSLDGGGTRFTLTLPMPELPEDSGRSTIPDHAAGRIAA